MVVRDNNPNWYFLPRGDSHLMLLYRQILFQSAPGAYDKYVDTNETAMNIVIFCRDKTAETIPDFSAVAASIVSPVRIILSANGPPRRWAPIAARTGGKTPSFISGHQKIWSMYTYDSVIIHLQ